MTSTPLSTVFLNLLGGLFLAAGCYVTFNGTQALSQASAAVGDYGNAANYAASLAAAQLSITGGIGLIVTSFFWFGLAALIAHVARAADHLEAIRTASAPTLLPVEQL